MLKSRTGNERSVHWVTLAIAGRSLVLVIVNRVVCAVVCGELKSTSKYGSSSVAAGAVLMSHASSLFVVVGPDAAPPTPNAKVEFDERCPLANAEPAIRRVATMARTKNFFIFLSYTM